GKYVCVFFVEQFDSVWKRTMLAIVVNFKKPNNCCKQYNWAFDEEIPLLQNPRLVKVKHNGRGSFVSIRYVRHKFRIKRVTAGAPAWVIKIDNIKLGGYFILISML